MKTFKKVAVLVVAIAMMLTLTIPALAVEPVETHTITINNSNDGHTYGAYQVFDGQISDKVLVNIEWGTAVQNPQTLLTDLKAGTYETLDFTACKTALDVNDQLKDENVSVDDLNAFAKVVGTYFVKNNISATAVATYNTTNYTVDVATGYYLVKDDAKVTGVDSTTLYMLDVAKDITMNPKSDVPTVVKKVLEDTDVTDYSNLDVDYNDVADWDMLQTKAFRLYGTIPANFEELKSYETYKFIFHDTYSKGISVEDNLNYTVSYRINGVETTLDNSTFVLTQDKANRTLTFDCADLKAVLGDDIYKNPTIAITYDAVLNKNAVVGLPGNPNEVYLEFSNDAYNSKAEGDLQTGEEHPTGQTEKDVVIVFTYALGGNKVDADTKDTLQGAEFILKNANGEFAVVKNNFFQNWTTNKADATTLLSDENGNFKVIGLDADTYFLKETKAPAGYNMLQNDIELVISSSYNDNQIYKQDWNTFVATDALTTINLTVDGTKTEAPNGVGVLDIENSKGSTLPGTGGMGTTIVYILSALLIVVPAIILIRKKRSEV